MPGWDENVPKERRAGLGRDAEEGFCELVAYLLMDSQRKKGRKNSSCKTVTPAARLTLFIEAEKRYGFDQVLDWMKYGVAAQLEAGQVDKLRDVRMPVAKPVVATPVVNRPRTKPVSRPGRPQARRDSVGQPAGGHHQRPFLSDQ